MQPACYAQRLLNPFRGVMNIIEHQGAEAVTTDGYHWDIYVRDNALVEDLANSRKVQTSDIRYGSWSPAQGLRRGALYPSDDFKQLELLGANVYEYLLEHHTDVPFALLDRYELWLLDEHDQPLALLDSVMDEALIELDRPIDWRAGQECRKMFTTPLLTTVATASGVSSAGEYLTSLINTHAGENPRAQWFRRLENGAGQAMAGIGIGDDLQQRELPGQAFAELFVRTPGENDAHDALLEAYLDWQAPCLLLLQHLGDGQRMRFEQQAARRALAVEKHYRLYPKILDPEMIRAARVEAMLRAGDTDNDDEDAMATYYIELNVTRTN